jgi:hypothetical protein
MKRQHVGAIVAIGFGLFLALMAIETQGQAPVGKQPPERIETDVLRVFAAKDGNAVFRAYLIKWKGQKVIISDPLAKTDFKVRDKVTVLVMNHPYPRGKAGPSLLHFQSFRLADSAPFLCSRESD